MDKWVEFYEQVFGMTEMLHFSDEDISTEYSALMSKVMSDGQGKIKFPINEPAEGRRKSQIEEYLEFNHGPGSQHIAMQTADIVGTVEALTRRGVIFLNTPEAYYDETPDRVGTIDENWDDLRRLRILADRDDDGYLLQIFTKTVAGPADALLRGDRTPRRPRLRRRELQGAVRGHRARTGAARQPLTRAMTPQRRAALVSVAAAATLLVLKLIVGLETHSLGLVSEAAHSGTDLVAALLTFFALRVAARPADVTHQFGHGKAEHLSALAEAGFLSLASVFISVARDRARSPADARPRARSRGMSSPSSSS